MGDLIDRQAAIDALKNRWKKTRNYEGNGDDIAEECELYLKQVPSAQPELSEIKRDLSDLISRQDAIDAIRASTKKYTGYMEMEMYTDDDAVEAIEGLPSAQPDLSGYSSRLWKAAYERGKAEAQRTGKWIRNPDDTAGSGYFICSECGTDFYDVWKYCPNCGAKME